MWDRCRGSILRTALSYMPSRAAKATLVTPCSRMAVYSASFAATTGGTALFSIQASFAATTGGTGTSTWPSARGLGPGMAS